MKKTVALMIVTPIILLAAASCAAAEKWVNRIERLAGDGSIMAVDGRGNTIIAYNADRSYIPASSLKIVTAAAALETLGPDYRFKTDFYLTPENNLFVVGYGDPHLVSEELALIARTLKKMGLEQVNGILLNNSYFQPKILIEGTDQTRNPYNALNGALCVNFNTIFVNIGKKGRLTSAESQTPLTDLTRRLAAETKLRGRRIRFSLKDNPEDCLLYAGELLKKFLEMAGVKVHGAVSPALTPPLDAKLFYRHLSSKDLIYLAAKLFKYSNNFMANQIFLTMGAEKYGPPATLQKGRRVVNDFFKTHNIPELQVEEGSGLSRRNRLTAGQMIHVLKVFVPYRELLDGKGRSLYKTGTLHDVKAAAGYIVPIKGPPQPFVILLNGPKVSAGQRLRILQTLEKNLP